MDPVIEAVGVDKVKLEWTLREHSGNLCYLVLRVAMVSNVTQLVFLPPTDPVQPGSCSSFLVGQL